MISTLRPAFEQVDTLEVSQASARAEWLVITAGNEYVVSSVLSALEGKDFVSLMASDQPTLFDDAELDAAIGAVLNKFDIKHVVLVCGGLGEDQGGTKEEDHQDLFAGARQQNVEMRRSREQFAARFQRFLASAAISKAVCEGRIVVSGLLYRDCDGAFQLYDHITEQFRTLTTLSCVANAIGSNRP